MGDGPEEEQDGKGREQAAHGVDHQGDVGGVGGEVYEEAAHEHEDGVARRVSYLELVSLDYELSAVPVGGGRLKSEPIGGERYEKHEPAAYVVD